MFGRLAAACFVVALGWQAGAAAAATPDNDCDAWRRTNPIPDYKSQAHEGPPWDRPYPFVRRCVRDAAATYLVTWDRHGVTKRKGGSVVWTAKLAADLVALTADGDVVVADYSQVSLLRGSDGAKRWSHPYQDDKAQRCGAPADMAVGYKGEILLTCGYSLVRLTPQGKRQWQQWPIGNKPISGPLVDRNSVAYVTGNQRVAAVDANGKTLWTYSLGFNRAAGPMAVTLKGELLFNTGMAARHSETTRGGYRFYYEHEPPELLVLTRAGKLVSKTPSEKLYRSGKWPAHRNLSLDGAHRMP